MKLEEQCTTIEQSKTLLKMGFSKDTASLEFLETKIAYKDKDGRLKGYNNWEIGFRDIWNVNSIPCWTIGDMIALLPNSVPMNKIHRPLELAIVDDNKSLNYRNNYWCKESFRDNLFDCLVWLKDNKYI